MIQPFFEGKTHNIDLDLWKYFFIFKIDNFDRLYSCTVLTPTETV